MPDLLAQRVALSPDQTAISEPLSGRSVSYAALDDQAGRAAAVLVTLGVVEGGRVALLCRNRIETFTLLFACARLGAILVPLNWRLSENELRKVVANAEPGLLLHDREFADCARALAAGEGFATWCLDEERATGFAARMRAVSEPIAPQPRRANRIWYLLYTSGTTGEPKGVIYTYGMALANHVNVAGVLAPTPDDCCLTLLPLFHTAGINLYALPMLFSGGCVLLLPDADAAAALDLVTSGAVSLMFAVPTVYDRMARLEGFACADLSRARYWGSGGAALPDRLVLRFAERGAILCNGMGMTETGPTAFVMDRGQALAKLGSVGRPQLLVEVRLIAGDRVAGVDEPGEVWFAGPGVTPGYWRAPDPVLTLADGRRWLRSGDLARRDADGYYTIVGRLGDMFVSGGENVHPAEIEGVLARHPAIEEAVVMAEADAEWGEVPVAFLLRRATLPEPDTAELVAFCRSWLAGFKTPRRFAFVDEFPRTASGKARRIEPALSPASPSRAGPEGR